MKKYLFFYVILYGFFSNAQNTIEEEVVGVYQMRQGPDDMVSIIILPNHHYVIAYFGGMQKGTWELQDNFINLTQTAEPTFILYGRKRESYKNKTTIRYNVEASNRVFVSWQTAQPKDFVPVFNNMANCFSYPYIQALETKLKNLYVSQLGYSYGDQGLNKVEIQNFKIPEAYNELILINLSQEYTHGSKQKAMFKDGKLYLESNVEGISKRPLESLSREDKAYMSQFSNQSLFKEQLSWGDEFFPYYENPNPEESQPFYRVPINKKDTQSPSKTKKAPLFVAECENNPE